MPSIIYRSALSVRIYEQKVEGIFHRNQRIGPQLERSREPWHNNRERGNMREASSVFHIISHQEKSNHPGPTSLDRIQAALQLYVGQGGR
jgi:hypothetical protein